MRRGLTTSREQARDAVLAGRVLVGGTLADKPARLVAPHEPLELVGDRPRFVGRGGEKLHAALDRFDLVVTGKRALDAGASTGGFTDCLLQRGARFVVAVDVGYGQLHERLRADPRVEVHERTDIRAFRPDERFELVVADLSFISLRTVAPALVGLAAPGGDLVVLVKPQFEAGRTEVSKGRGVVRDPEVRERAVAGVRSAMEEAGAAMIEVMESPLTGADGNVEFLAHLRAPSR